MSSPLPVAIIGAGPAGSTLARFLALGGAPPVLIDEREPHEKPCGGGVSLRGYQGRPILEETGSTLVREAVVESGRARVSVILPEPLRIYPRRRLNRILFDAALRSGARFVQARAHGLKREESGFRIELEGQASLRASFLAGADGAAGISRKLLGGGRGRARFVLASGFHAERSGAEEAMYLGFPPGLPGYLWIFPRGDHSAVGICSRDRRQSARALGEILHAELKAAGRRLEPIPGTDYSFPIPDFTAFEGPRSGERWALIGDAGGFVDPITLEGISYAMRSAEVLAEALLSGEPGRFEQAWRADFGREIARAARIVDRFYSGDFTSRMVRSAASSPRVREILGGLLSGVVPYRRLRGRVVRALLADRASSFIPSLIRRLAPSPG